MNLPFKKLVNKIIEQRPTTPFFGAVISAYSSTAILYSPLTLIGVVTTVYGLWGGSIIRQWIPWFETWMLLIAMIVFILIMMVFFWRIIIPSQMAFTVQQYYKHQNPMVKDLAEGLENDKLILEKLEAIEKRLELLERK